MNRKNILAVGIWWLVLILNIIDICSNYNIIYIGLLKNQISKSCITLLTLNIFSMQTEVWSYHHIVSNYKEQDAKVGTQKFERNIYHAIDTYIQ